VSIRSNDSDANIVGNNFVAQLSDRLRNFLSLDVPVAARNLEVNPPGAWYARGYHPRRFHEGGAREHPSAPLTFFLFPLAGKYSWRKSLSKALPEWPVPVGNNGHFAVLASLAWENRSLPSKRDLHVQSGELVGQNLVRVKARRALTQG